MSGPQPNALAAITAALAAKQPGGIAAPAALAPPTPTSNPFTAAPAPHMPPVVTPLAQPFAFVPQAAPASVQAPSNPFTATQPSPVQAQAMFVAAVPCAAEQHVHPSTGVLFAPINPPGEATSAPTVGLDAALTSEHFGPAPSPVQIVQQVQTTIAPTASGEAAPKAPRTRRAKKDVDAILSAPLPQLDALFAGDGAAAPAAESVAPSVEYAPSVMREFSTEEMRNELVRRGWAVTLA